MEGKHIEYRYKSENSDTVIVFIHGIQGSPLQFDYIIENLNESYSIENLLLPGHGKTAKDFSKSSMTQWQNYVNEKIEQLQNDYKNIILVGHSMGCLLSIQAAIMYPMQIRGLFLISMPLKIHISFPFIKNSLVVALSKNTKNDIIAAARKGNSIMASTPSEYLMGIPRYIELLKKSKSTRQLIEKLHIPMVVVQSDKDEIVSSRTLNYVNNKRHIQVVIANNAGHYYYSQEAQKQISKTLEYFIASLT